MSAEPPVPVGDVVDGKYRVERVLGSGGMGIVVAAEHLKLGRTVALKFLHPHACDNREAVTRFLREGQALASITSTHVARVMDVGTLERGEPYLVMEYLDGADLGAVLKRDGPFSIADATRYVLEVCEAVAEAHAKGIVHRDLKPSNLFLTTGADGMPLVKVLDFGISKAVVQPAPAAPSASDAPTVPPAHVTNTGALVGSPLYMSPEQIRNARRVDERTDIWALGVILYELVCGALPFEGETLAGTLAAVSADAPRSMHSFGADVPHELEAVILRCLEKAPERRFASIASLARALEPFAPAESRAGVDRIVRLLGVPGSKSTRAEPGPAAADESAPTVPSWEGNTVPHSARVPTFRRRAWFGFVLGGVAAVAAWIGLGGTTHPPRAVGSASLDAAPALPTPDAAERATPMPASSVAFESTRVPAPAASNSATSVRAESPPPSTAVAPISSAKPKRTNPKLPAPSPSAPAHASKAAVDDGTEDRK